MLSKSKLDSIGIIFPCAPAMTSFDNPLLFVFSCACVFVFEEALNMPTDRVLRALNVPTDRVLPALTKCLPFSGEIRLGVA